MKLKNLRHPLLMFNIVRFVWKARRPSTLHDMPAVVDTFWLRKGYEALTFFGTIIVGSRQEADRLNAVGCGSGSSGSCGSDSGSRSPSRPTMKSKLDRQVEALKRHEMIHLRQAVDTGDSWWRFYRLYLRYWLQGWRQRRRYPNAGYRLNPFEMEAYEHMYDSGYLDRCRDGASGWRRYARMSVDERHRLLAPPHSTAHDNGGKSKEA